MNDKVLYFAYGANKTHEMMTAITGKENLVGQEATLDGFGIFVQRIDQIPQVIAPNSPTPISPQQIIRDAWGDRPFETYVIKPDENKQTIGTVWELTRLERELVRNWELIDFGWYQDAKVKIITANGQEIEAQTEIMGSGQEVDREINGLDYPPFLNKLEDFQRVAQETREEYLSMIEGKPPLKKERTKNPD